MARSTTSGDAADAAKRQSTSRRQFGNGSRQDSRGHMLLVAIVLATVMSVFLALAVRPLRTQTQRMKERQLVYRGRHIAQGIQRFYFKYKRFPFELEELIDSEPRFIRQLYPDPMTPDGSWDLVYLSPLDRSAIQQLNLPSSLTAAAENLGDRAQESKPTDPNTAQANSVFAVKTQQITGIRSKSDRTGFMVIDDSRIYSDWLFTALPRATMTLEDAKRKSSVGTGTSPFQ